jgi:hypothetical protein
MIPDGIAVQEENTVDADPLAEGVCGFCAGDALKFLIRR